MLVTCVLGDCPGCGGKQLFGNVSISGNSVLRGCKSCKYSIRICLPKIRKKIVYLDQFFFSSAFRARDGRFIKAAKQIRHVSELQLLAAPFSSIHEDETHQWRGYDGKSKEALMDFIKATSRGHEFEPAYMVERRQIKRAFQAFLDNDSPVVQLQENDAIKGNIHEWDDYFRIDVGKYIGDVELTRNLKQQSVEGLIDLLPEWRKSNNNYEQNVALELQASAKNYLDSYYQYAVQLISGDGAAFLNAPIASMVVQSLLYQLPSDLRQNHRFKKIGEFFASSHFSEVPYQFLSAHIFATLKDMIKLGAYKNREKAKRRLGGFFHDVKHVATYAPYCDAFVLDQAMASLLEDRRIGLEDRYNVKIFSLNNWDELSAWLEGLEKEASTEHYAGLAAAYP